MRILLVISLMLCVAGCSTHYQYFKERITNPDGSISETSNKQLTATSVGSKLQEGSGTLAYSNKTGKDKGWDLKLGTNAKGLEAGDGSQFVQGVVALGQLMAPVAQSAITSGAFAKPTVQQGMSKEDIIAAIRELESLLPKAQ